MILMLIVGVAPGKIEGHPYIHQTLFIASVAAFPQLWFEHFSKKLKGRLGAAWLVGLAALPLGVAIWSAANIWIVKAEAHRAANGEPYCLLLANGGYGTSYVRPQSDWRLAGLNMVSGHYGSGSGGCCQWDFHALMLKHDGQLFNWSYKSQQFETMSDQSRKVMRLTKLSCK
ncbi:hypothetical protein ACSVBT_07735 [Afipia sp. TerB]